MTLKHYAILGGSLVLSYLGLIGFGSLKDSSRPSRSSSLASLVRSPSTKVENTITNRESFVNHLNDAYAQQVLGNSK